MTTRPFAHLPGVTYPDTTPKPTQSRKGIGKGSWIARDPERCARIIAMATAGEKNSFIAAQMKCTPDTVTRILMRAGVYRRRSRIVFTPAEDAIMLAMHRSGAPRREISDKINREYKCTNARLRRLIAKEQANTSAKAA
jgi:DNA-binding NarL/FixJ family response regulator